ncbi:Rrf2 family transcriptional regulator [Paenibacillus hunanensis]|uniref:DNA-binding IscR family transcriptional regulator n=1 Tax=Paenibacillus hunanensis TaxID=539262 RepID=A0ABU1IXU1_9BACL|nr:Rrf2 family transcriptional regulator [Paenibacillus hunanensis]MDR6244075.1 DNA-binding IscR family transcriptional regulator [Paenibacillus hunanensis]WPP41094.1 Rrf2 family transcriptional regulator [Paenibacillus hunanensis]GGJ14833.1 putative HTH-type transcriptional regulator YwnA [Paenibacillus hunanensis]
MAYNSRFAVAIHTLSLLDSTEGRITSELIAGSVNTNPVVIRRMISLLTKAGILRTQPGVAGAQLTRPSSEITLLDVYRAVQNDSRDDLFAIHENPNPNCDIGRNIQQELEQVFARAQRAMEGELEQITLRQVTTDLQQMEEIRQTISQQG